MNKLGIFSNNNGLKLPVFVQQYSDSLQFPEQKMRLNKPALSPDIDLFHNRLDSVIDRWHELCRLAASEPGSTQENLCMIRSDIAGELLPSAQTYGMNRHGAEIVCPVVWEQGGSNPASCPMRLLATPARMKLGTRQLVSPSKLVTRLSSWVARVVLPSVDPQFGGGGGGGA